MTVKGTSGAKTALSAQARKVSISSARGRACRWIWVATPRKGRFQSWSSPPAITPAPHHGARPAPASARSSSWPLTAASSTGPPTAGREPGRAPPAPEAASSADAVENEWRHVSPLTHTGRLCPPPVGTRSDASDETQNGGDHEQRAHSRAFARRSDPARSQAPRRDDQPGVRAPRAAPADLSRVRRRPARDRGLRPGGDDRGRRAGRRACDRALAPGCPAALRRRPHRCRPFLARIDRASPGSGRRCAGLPISHRGPARRGAACPAGGDAHRVRPSLRPGQPCRRTGGRRGASGVVRGRPPGQAYRRVAVPAG